jgi:hypothetical protein
LTDSGVRSNKLRFQIIGVMQMRSIFITAATITLFILTLQASASVIQIGEGAFVAGSGLITFSEKPFGSQNPTYAPGDYGGGVGSPMVTFGGFFSGQSLGNAATCPAGAALSGCVVGSPTGPLNDQRSFARHFHY